MTPVTRACFGTTVKAQVEIFKNTDSGRICCGWLMKTGGTQTLTVLPLHTHTNTALTYTDVCFRDCPQHNHVFRSTVSPHGASKPVSNAAR